MAASGMLAIAAAAGRGGPERRVVRHDEAAVGAGEDVDLEARAEPPAEGEVGALERRFAERAS